MTAKRPAGVPIQEWVFLRAATWPDYVRPPLKPAKPDLSIVRYHRPDDHFADFPIFARDATPEFMARVRALPSRHDVICALKQRVAELELHTAADEDRAIALCWLLHLTGDIHQPLHCASLYIEGRFSPPQGDFGGNAIGFRFGPRKTPARLHTYWDDMLGATSDDPMGEIKDTEQHAEEAYKLASLKASALTQTYSRAGLDELKARPEFKAWAAESLELAQKVGYADRQVAEVAVKVPTFPEPVPNTIPEEPAGYSDRAPAVAERRGVVAGYRLQDLVRRTLPKE